MYTPKYFREQRDTLVREIVDNYPFALLLTPAAEQLHASHLPFVMNASQGEHGTLYAHTARANPHWKALTGTRSTVVFQGPHAYVSPGWYLERRTVPTWNYAVVHLHGQATLIDDEDETLARLAELVGTHEAPGGWSFADNLATVRAELPGIVAFRLPVERIEAKFKLSQNLPARDHQSVIEHLRASDDETTRELAELMGAR